jgi:hypothetical protein
MVGSLRDLVEHYARTSTWKFTLASASACASFQLPLPTDNLITRGLFFLAAIGVGALAGRWLDRRRKRSTISPASTKSATSSATAATSSAAAGPTGAELAGVDQVGEQLALGDGVGREPAGTEVGEELALGDDGGRGRARRRRGARARRSAQRRRRSQEPARAELAGVDQVADDQAAEDLELGP